MIEEIDRLKRDNLKAWKLVEELEKENSALIIANRNNLHELNKKIRIKRDFSRDSELSKLNKKNKVLREVIIKQYGISADALNGMISQGLKDLK